MDRLNYKIYTNILRFVPDEENKKFKNLSKRTNLIMERFRDNIPNKWPQVTISIDQEHIGLDRYHQIFDIRSKNFKCFARFDKGVTFVGKHNNKPKCCRKVFCNYQQRYDNYLQFFGWLFQRVDVSEITIFFPMYQIVEEAFNYVADRCGVRFNRLRLYTCGWQTTDYTVYWNVLAKTCKEVVIEKAKRIDFPDNMETFEVLQELFEKMTIRFTPLESEEKGINGPEAEFILEIMAELLLCDFIETFNFTFPMPPMLNRLEWEGAEATKEFLLFVGKSLTKKRYWYEMLHTEGEEPCLVKADDGKSVIIRVKNTSDCLKIMFNSE